jgi:large subunit ribosomal protein L25
MEQVELSAKVRTVSGRHVKRLRREGWVPAILYGRGLESRSIQVAAREARSVVAEAGSSQLVVIRIADEKPVKALVRDFQLDPIRRDLLHIDLYQVDMTQEITVEVPLVLVGQAPPVEQHEGILLQSLGSVEMACMPDDLVDAIEVDLSDLTEVDMQITVGDLAVPSTVRVLSDLNTVVVRVSAIEEAPEEEEEEELEFVAEIPVEPEVVARGKAEAEEEE